MYSLLALIIYRVITIKIDIVTLSLHVNLQQSIKFFILNIIFFIGGLLSASN